MEDKNKVGNLFNLSFVIYLVILTYPIKSLINSGVIGTDTKLFQIMQYVKVGSGLFGLIFTIMILSFIFIEIKIDSKNIIKSEDEEKLKILNKKLYIYKIFIVLNIIGTIILLLLTKNKELLLPSILLVVASIIIHSSKKVYFEYYLFDRKRIWLEKTTDEKCISTKNIKSNKRKLGRLIIFFTPLILFIGFSINHQFSKHDAYQDYSTIENKVEALSLDELGKYKVIDISNKKNHKGVNIELDKLYLGKKGSKLFFSVTNNSDKGMVLNLNYNTFIKSAEGENSNILLPGVKYDLEMDILQKYDKVSHKELDVTLEYTLSETILYEYSDYANNNFYPLNVVDNSCEVTVDLVKEGSTMNFSDYDQFYKKQEEIVKFK